MPGFKDLLLENGPQIAMMLLAAKQGGPQAVSGLMEGLQAKAQRREQQQRQTTIDQQAMEDRAFRRSDIEADNARADMQFKQQQFEKALALMQRAAEMQGETASDPAQVEAALQEQAGAIGGQYGVPAEQLTRFMPPAAPIVAKGVKADIAGLMESAAAESRRRNQPYDDTTITFAWSKLKPRLQQALISAGHPEGQDVKPSTLDQLRGLVVSQAPKAAKPPTPGSFEDYLAAPPERRAEIEAARKGYMQADDRPPAQPISIVVGPQGPMRVNRATGEALPVTDPSGQQVPPPLTEEQRNLAARRDKLIPAIEQMEALGARLITKIGPAQRAEAIKRGAEAVLGNDPEFRTYQDARVALAGNLAVAQQGSRPSDADIRAVWLPLVPDVFRDTKESAAMKWNMIRTNMSLPTSGGGANQAIEDALKAQGITGTVKAIRPKAK